MDPITLNSEAKNTGRNIENKNKITLNENSIRIIFLMSNQKKF